MVKRRVAERVIQMVPIIKKSLFLHKGLNVVQSAMMKHTTFNLRLLAKEKMNVYFSSLNL